MMVNSKLTKEQKAIHQELLEELSALNGKVFCFPEYSVTVAIMPEFTGSRMMLVSVSVAESREKKFRCKVGEYHAIRRLIHDNEYLKLPTLFYNDNGWLTDEEMLEYPQEWAENFAASLFR